MKHSFIRKLSLVLALLTLLGSCMTVLSGCGKKNEYKDFDYFVMDTYVTVRLATEGKNGRLSDEYLAEVADGCADILTELDGILSSHNEASQVYALNSNINMMLGADSTLVSVIQAADRITKITGGAYDYALGALTELWNVNGGGPVPTASDINYATIHSGSDKFKISGTTITKLDGMAKIDLGGIGKGYAAQEILNYLETTDVLYGIISIGGNVGVYGEKPKNETYKIGVRDPEAADRVIGYMYLTSGFVSVSGDYERYFEEDGVRYHHIIDKSTGYPADSGLKSVAVHTTNGASADALSTALFVMGVERSIELYNSGEIEFEAVFITDDGRVITTPGLDSKSFQLTAAGYKLEETSAGK